MAASQTQGSLGPAAAGLLSGLSVGKLRKNSTIRRATQTAESLERLNQLLGTHIRGVAVQWIQAKLYANNSAETEQPALHLSKPFTFR